MKILMTSPTLKSDALLLLTATIWGFAFVAQRVGMDFVGPFAFNGIRFALGSLVLVPFVLKPDRGPTGVAVLGGDNRPLTILWGGGLAAMAYLFAWRRVR